MLDTKVSLTDGHLKISMFKKPTVNPQPLAYNSCHPSSCVNSIPPAAFKRVCRINSDKNEATQWISETKQSFIKAGYPNDLLQTSSRAALETPRERLLERSQRNSDKDNTPFYVTTFHPSLYKVAGALHENFNILQQTDKGKKVFKRPPIKAWRRGINMKEILCPSRLPPISAEIKRKGFTKCSQPNCALCPFALDTSEFNINGKNRKITQSLNCKSKSGIYAIKCVKCSLYYIGRTADTVEMRFRGHKRDIEDRLSLKNLARHFQSSGHNVQRDLQMFFFIKMNDWRRLPDVESESIAFFNTQNSGLNQRE